MKATHREHADDGLGSPLGVTALRMYSFSRHYSSAGAEAVIKTLSDLPQVS